MIHSYTSGMGSRDFESYYRVLEVKEFVPRVGIDGRGLLRFWGQRASRVLPGRGPAPRVWDMSEPDDEFVLAVSEVVDVVNDHVWIDKFGDDDEDE